MRSSSVFAMMKFLIMLIVLHHGFKTLMRLTILACSIFQALLSCSHQTFAQSNSVLLCNNDPCNEQEQAR